VSQVPAREFPGGALLRRVRDPAGPDMLELRDSTVSRGQVLPRLRSPVASAAGTPSRSPDSYTPKHLAERIINSKAALEGPATNHGCTVMELRSEKVSRGWVYFDNAHLLRQLGVLPA
jgi:hypothetical protein